MARKKEWREGEMILTFKLNKINEPYTDLMNEWLDVELPQFEDWEQKNFATLVAKKDRVMNWSEEDLKMKFISPILELAGVLESKHFASFFDKKLEAKVDDHLLSVRADFLIAKGLLDYMERPFFHFQEYKPQRNPTGDSMAQLLEAFLIGQVKNDDKKPLYGCEVIGPTWRFVTMEGRNYCVSKAFDSMDTKSLLQIIAILRKFREILETRLLD